MKGTVMPTENFRRHLRTIAGGLILLSAAGTAPDQAPFAQDMPDWGYNGSRGPETWGALSPAYSQCRDGRSQSPINIEGTDPVLVHALETDYTVVPLEVVNSGKGMHMAASGVLRVGEKSFRLERVDFHTPSEHRILGRLFEMEVQFHHRGSDGSLATVAVLVEPGRASAAADEIWPHLPLEPGQRNRPEAVAVNARDLMPSDKHYYRYMGSQTVPPCTEGVHWYVLKTPLTLSSVQISAAKALIGTNSRPVQARNNRMILDAEAP